MVTFTTLGYGDITLSSDWRILSGLEGINGMLLIGCYTTMLFALFQQLFEKQQHYLPKRLTGNKK